MRRILVLVLGSALAACAAEPTSGYVHAVTLEECIPQPSTLRTAADLDGAGQLPMRCAEAGCQIDFVDCSADDGSCTFPRPGCDAHGCCFAELVATDSAAAER